MTLTTTQALLIALAVTAGAMLTRFLPFLLFPDNRPVPKIVSYLGRTLPAAMMGLLVVYCLRNVSVVSAPHGLPELISIAMLAALHLWKRNVLLSIGVGTVLSAKKVLILATGHKKARAVRHGVEGSYNHQWTISALQVHPNGILVCDDPAAEELRVATYRYFKDIERENLISK